jgi:hypothetical protein
MRRRYDPTTDLWCPLSVDEVRPVLAGSRAWLSGGVALDLWLGITSRPHGDIDISVLADDWPRLAAMLPARLRPYAAQSGWLTPLDEATTDEPIENIWCLDELRGAWRLQVNIETGDAERWTYRRDPGIHRPWSEAVIDVDGVRMVAPAVQLLWKSLSPEPKDDADLRLVNPLLPAVERTWLADSIASAHPDSRWVRTVR